MIQFLKDLLLRLGLLSGKIKITASSAHNRSQINQYANLRKTIETDINKAVELGYFSCSLDILVGDKYILNKIVSDLKQLGFYVETPQSTYPKYIKLHIYWDTMSINPLNKAINDNN